MSSLSKRKGPDSTPHRIEAQHSKNHQRQFTKVIEIGASVILFAVLGLMFADGLTDASGHFGPGPEIAVQLAGGVHE